MLSLVGARHDRQVCIGLAGEIAAMGHGHAGIGIGLAGSDRCDGLLLRRDADQPLRRNAGSEPGLLLNLPADDDEAGAGDRDGAVACQQPTIG